MNNEDKALLNKHKKDLVAQMSTEDLVDDLVDDKVLDSKMKARIEKQSEFEERSTLLLDAIMKSSNPDAMKCFLNTLERTHGHLHKLLTEKRPAVTAREPPKSETKPQKELSFLNPQQIWYISDIIKFPEWQQFGRALGFRDNDLDEIESNYGRNHRESSHRMLIKWREGYPEKCNIETLCAALRSFRKADIAIKLREYADTDEFKNTK